MLKIYYGDLESDNYIFNPDVFFNNSFRTQRASLEAAA